MTQLTSKAHSSSTNQQLWQFQWSEYRRQTPLWVAVAGTGFAVGGAYDTGRTSQYLRELTNWQDDVVLSQSLYGFAGGFFQYTLVYLALFLLACGFGCFFAIVREPADTDARSGLPWIPAQLLILTGFTLSFLIGAFTNHALAQRKFSDELAHYTHARALAPWFDSWGFYWDAAIIVGGVLVIAWSCWLLLIHPLLRR